MYCREVESPRLFGGGGVPTRGSHFTHLCAQLLIGLIALCYRYMLGSKSRNWWYLAIFGKVRPCVAQDGPQDALHGEIAACNGWRLYEKCAQDLGTIEICLRLPGVRIGPVAGPSYEVHAHAVVCGARG